MSTHNVLKLPGLYYLTPLGDKYKGLLIITKSEFLFEADFDETFRILNRSNLLNINGKDMFSILKEDISSVEFRQSFLRKKMIVSQNGRAHQFVGMNLSKSTIYNAIKNDENE